MNALPEVVSLRWHEAAQNPSIPRWRSLAQLVSAYLVNAEVRAPDAESTRALRRVGDAAHRNMLAMQPPQEWCLNGQPSEFSAVVTIDGKWIDVRACCEVTPGSTLLYALYDKDERDLLPFASRADRLRIIAEAA